MNVNVTVDPYISVCKHHVTSSCFCYINIFPTTELLTLIFWQREWVSQNHINLLLIVPIRYFNKFEFSLLSSVKGVLNLSVLLLRKSCSLGSVHNFLRTWSICFVMLFSILEGRSSVLMWALCHFWPHQEKKRLPHYFFFFLPQIRCWAKLWG